MREVPSSLLITHFVIWMAALFLPQTQSTIFGTLTVTPSTIMSSGSYFFVIDTTTIIPAGGYITITFPATLTLATTPTCTSSFGLGSSTPPCTASGNVLRVQGTGVFPNQNGVQIRVNTAVNAGSAQNITGFIMRFYNSANTQLDSTSTAFSFLYTPDVLISASLTPTSYVVGVYNTWTLSVTPKNQIPAGGIVRITFPKWNQAAFGATNPLSMLTSGAATCAPILGLTAGAVTCAFSVNALITGTDTLTITNAFPAIQAAGITFQITIANVRNPPTTRPYSFQVFTTDSSSYSINSLTTAVTLTSPNTLTTVAVSVSVDAPTTVDADTTYLFQVQVEHPIPVGGQIRILIPNEVGVGQLTTAISEQRIGSGVTISTISGNSRYILLSNGYTSSADYVPINGLVAFRLRYLTNPSTTSTTTSFQVQTYDSSFIIEEITIGLTVVASQGNITVTSISHSNQKVLENNAISFSFTLASQLQTGSYIQVTIPTEFTVTAVATSACSLLSVTGLFSGYTCAISGKVLTIFNPFGSASSALNTAVRFTIPSTYVRNPTSTRPTTVGFRIRSFSPSGTQIDSYTGSSFSAIVNDLSSVTVTSSSSVTGQNPVIFTFLIKTPYEVEKDAVIRVYLPTGVTVASQSLADRCTGQLTIQSSPGCRSSTNDFRVTSGFSSGLCTCSGFIQFQVPGMRNPRSTETTESFEVEFNTKDSYKIYQLRTGITLTMSTPTALTIITITQEKAINGALDTYLFTVRNNNINLDNDYMTIVAPTEVQFSNRSVCASRTNLKALVSCRFINTQEMKVTFDFSSRRVLLNAGAGFAFQVLNVKNPPSFKPSSSFQFFHYTRNGNAVSQITSGGPTITNKVMANITVASIRPSNYKLGENSLATFSILPTNYQSLMTMSISFPSDVRVASNALTTCSVISNITMSQNMACDYNSASRTLKILNAFTILSDIQFASMSQDSKTIRFSLGNIINPLKNESSAFTITTFDQFGFAMDVSNITLGYTCSTRCLACDSIDLGVCISCNRSSIFKVLYDGQCIETCPPGSEERDGICIECVNDCEYCSKNRWCDKCNTDFFLVKGLCYDNCPEGLIQSGSSCTTLQSSYLQYFRNYEQTCSLYIFCFMGIVIVSLVFCYYAYKEIRSKKNNEEDPPSKQAESKKHARIRLIETWISLLALVEVISWVFLGISLYQVDDIIPYIMVGSAILLNIILNIIMHNRIIKDIQEFENYNQSKAFKILMIVISYKTFYLNFIRYQNQVSQEKCSFFGYINNKHRVFLVIALLCTNCVCIGGAVLNFIKDDDVISLDCLDIDVIVLTFFQLLLVLITLLNACCTCQSAIQPSQPIKSSFSPPKNKKNGQTYMKSANNDTDEEEVSITDKSKKKRIHDRPQTNITHLNTSSHVLMDHKNTKTINQRSQLTQKSTHKLKKQIADEDSENLDTEQRENYNQSSRVTQKYRQSNLRNDEDDQDQTHKEKNQLFDIMEQDDYEMTGQFSRHQNNMGPQNIKRVQAERLSPFQSNRNRNQQHEINNEENFYNQQQNILRNRRETNNEKRNIQDMHRTYDTRNEYNNNNNNSNRESIEDLALNSSQIKTQRNYGRDQYMNDHYQAQQDSHFENQNEANNSKNKVQFQNSEQKINESQKETIRTQRQGKHTNLRNVQEIDVNISNLRKQDSDLVDQELKQMKITNNEKVNNQDEKTSKKDEKVIKINEKSKALRESVSSNALSQENMIVKGSNERQFGYTQISLTQNELMINTHPHATFEKASYEQSQNEFQLQGLPKGQYEKASQKHISEQEMNILQENGVYSQIGYSLPTQEFKMDSQPDITNNEDQQIEKIGSILDSQDLTKDLEQKEPIETLSNVQSYDYEEDEHIIKDKLNHNHAHSSQLSKEQESGLNKNQSLDIEQEESQRKNQSEYEGQRLSSQTENELKEQKRDNQPKRNSEEFKSIKRPSLMDRTEHIQDQDNDNDASDLEEIRDAINPDDVKQKKNILFSDKSESSIEEMMEDTPSNYNIPNGRLDEESKGLRSILYKSIVKKYMYDTAVGKKINELTASKEDQESQNITNAKLRASLEKKKSLNSKDEKQFVKGIVKDQEKHLAAMVKTEGPSKKIMARKRSIGEIESNAELRNQDDIANMNGKYRNKTPLRL